MKPQKSSRRKKRFPRPYVVKMTNDMYVEMRRLFGRQVSAKIREVLTSRIPSLSNKSSSENHVIKAKAPIFEAARMLAGCYASLRELQKLVGAGPSLTLARADLLEALRLVETRLGRTCALLAENGGTEPWPSSFLEAGAAGQSSLILPTHGPGSARDPILAAAIRTLLRRA
jgi:hypothetical protein